jgi:hypothetical protein
MASGWSVNAEIQLAAAAGLETGEPNGYTIVGEDRRQAGGGWGRRSLGVAAAVVAPLLIGATLYAASSHAGGDQHEMSFAGDGLIEEAAPPTTCEKYFDDMKRSKVLWSMSFWSLHFDAKDDVVKAEAIPWETEEEMTNIFHNNKTRNIQIYNTEVKNACQAGSRNVLWLYPMEDHNGAFDFNDWVCGRLATAYESSGADCINTYRVSNVEEISKILDEFVQEGSVVHAVVGGHGGPGPDGGIGLGPDEEKDATITKNKVSGAMFKKLGKRLVEEDPTMFLDSCYSGQNDMAKFASKEIPRAWVMGGIVSLDAWVNMLPGENGPPRIVSDFPSKDAEVPKFKGRTQAIRLFKGGEDLGLVTEYGAPAEDPDEPQADTAVPAEDPKEPQAGTGASAEDPDDPQAETQ